MLLGSNQFRSIWVVLGSFIIAGCMNLYPLGWFWGYFQPDWVALVLIYWCLWEPERMGAAAGWASGIFLDALDFGILGKHALAKTVLGFVSNRVSLRLRVYPVWQQCVGVAVLVGIDTLVVAAILFILELPPLSPGRWLTPFASMLMWPLVLVALHRRPGSRRGLV